MLQRGRDQRKGHPGVGRLAPAEAHPLPQHPRDLGDIAVGIRVGGAAPDNDQHGLVHRQFAMLGIGCGHGLRHPLARRLQHLQIDRQFTAIVDMAVVLRGVGVQD